MLESTRNGAFQHERLVARSELRNRGLQVRILPGVLQGRLGTAFPGGLRIFAGPLQSPNVIAGVTTVSRLAEVVLGDLQVVHLGDRAGVAEPQ